MGEACFNLHVSNVTVAEIVKELRARTGLSQGQLAKLGGVKRTEIAKVETHKNMATSDGMRTALAQGFGLPREVLVAVLDGAISVDAAVEARGNVRPLPAPMVLRAHVRERTVVRDDPYPTRRAFLILARAKGYDEAVLEVIGTEECKGGDPGAEYWRTRYREVKAEQRLIADLEDAPSPVEDPSAAEVHAKREAAKRRR